MEREKSLLETEKRTFSKGQGYWFGYLEAIGEPWIDLALSSRDWPRGTLLNGFAEYVIKEPFAIFEFSTGIFSLLSIRYF